MLKAGGWPALALIIMLVCGCSGVLLETKQEDGTVQRIKVDGGESWSVYDDKPRIPNKKYDDMSIMLKQEATF
jgi:hypothetical protein